MFMACGVGAFSAGIFHLMTHAFFKGLLFLAAGSVIHAVGGEQDMRKMGGLWKKIPWTWITMLIATCAIAGIPFLSGFYSKDEILWRAYQMNWVYWLVGVTTAFMTSFYMFRLMFMTFAGEYRGTAESHEHGDHAGASHAGAPTPHGHGHGGIHESPWVMLGPLVVLALLSICGGWIGAHRIEQFLSPATGSVQTVAESSAAAESESARAASSPAEESGRETLLTGVSVAAGLLGLLLAWLLYSRMPGLPDRIAASAQGLYSAVANKYWIDELYATILVKPLIGISRVVFWRTVDQGLIDGTLHASADSARELSDEVRHMQSGNLRSYAGWIAIGATAVIAYMVWVGTK